MLPVKWMYGWHIGKVARTKCMMLAAGRWQSQERAQMLKAKKLRERQSELEDALIDIKVSS